MPGTTYSSSCDPAPIRWRCIWAIAARSSVPASNQCRINASITLLGLDKCCAQSSSKAVKVLVSKRYVRWTVLGCGSGFDAPRVERGLAIMHIFYNGYDGMQDTKQTS